MAHYDCPKCGQQCGYYEGTSKCCKVSETPVQPMVTNTPNLVDVPLTTQNNTASRRFYEQHVGYRYEIYDSREPSSWGNGRTPIGSFDDTIPHYLLEAVLKGLNEAKPG